MILNITSALRSINFVCIYIKKHVYKRLKNLSIIFSSSMFWSWKNLQFRNKYHFLILHLSGSALSLIREYNYWISIYTWNRKYFMQCIWFFFFILITQEDRSSSEGSFMFGDSREKTYICAVWEWITTTVGSLRLHQIFW